MEERYSIPHFNSVSSTCVESSVFHGESNSATTMNACELIIIIAFPSDILFIRTIALLFTWNIRVWIWTGHSSSSLVMIIVARLERSHFSTSYTPKWLHSQSGYLNDGVMRNDWNLHDRIKNSLRKQISFSFSFGNHFPCTDAFWFRLLSRYCSVRIEMNNGKWKNLCEKTAEQQGQVPYVQSLDHSEDTKTTAWYGYISRSNLNFCNRTRQKKARYQLEEPNRLRFWTVLPVTSTSVYAKTKFIWYTTTKWGTNTQVTRPYPIVLLQEKGSALSQSNCAVAFHI